MSAATAELVVASTHCDTWDHPRCRACDHRVDWSINPHGARRAHAGLLFTPRRYAAHLTACLSCTVRSLDLRAIVPVDREEALAFGVDVIYPGATDGARQWSTGLAGTAACLVATRHDGAITPATPWTRGTPDLAGMR